MGFDLKFEPSVVAIELRDEKHNRFFHAGSGFIIGAVDPQHRKLIIATAAHVIEELDCLLGEDGGAPLPGETKDERLKRRINAMTPLLAVWTPGTANS